MLHIHIHPINSNGKLRETNLYLPGICMDIWNFTYTGQTDNQHGKNRDFLPHPRISPSSFRRGCYIKSYGKQDLE